MQGISKRTKSHQLSACSPHQCKQKGTKYIKYMEQMQKNWEENTWKPLGQIYTGKLDKNWERKNMDRRTFRVPVAPRVKSRFAVGGSRCGRSPKMLKTCSLPTTWVFKACVPSHKMKNRYTQRGSHKYHTSEMLKLKTLKLVMSDLGK